MTPDLHERITELFSAASELPAGDRAEFLNKACAGDAFLREEVESLLAHDHSAESALDSPVLGAGFNVTQTADANHAMATDLPEKIGPYRVLGLLGVGSMGVVYRAQQESPNRAVALKIMHPGRISKSLHRRLLGEMASLARLRHPGIAQIYDAGTDQTRAGPRPYMAMELVEGSPLMAYVQDKTLGPEARLSLLAKICDAVQHAHQHGVIHRDLKPANILVEDGDDGPQPRILDFGVARIIDLDVRTATLATEHGQLVGTLAYMSPEQVSADPAEIDTRSDIYALGVIGYELLCGELPIDVSRMSVFAALQAIREQSPQPLAIHDRRFRGDLSTILTKALAKDKNRRYESASMLATDIRHYLAHRPIMAHAPSPLYALRKFIRRHRLVAAALMLGGLATAFGLIRAHQASVELASQYRETRDVAGFLVGDFAANLDRIGGTTELRRDLLKRLHTHVQLLLIRNPQDATLLRAQADVLDRMSDIDLAEGRSQAALLLREQSLDIRRQLVTLDSTDPERKADLSIALVRIGDIFRPSNELRQVESWFKQALDVDELLVREHPRSRRLLDNLAHSYARMGCLEAALKRSVDAERFYNQALDTYARLLNLFPDQLITLYGCWEIEWFLAEMAAEAGQMSLAETHARNSFDYAYRLVAEAPDNRVYLAAYAYSRFITAKYSRADGHKEDASQELEDACRIYEKLYTLDPQDMGNQREFCMVLQNYSELLLNWGRPDEAYSRAEQAVTIGRGLLSKNPASADYVRLLAGSLRSAGRAALALGLREQASLEGLEHLELLRRLAESESPGHEDLHLYARRLLWPVLPEWTDPLRALDFARRAVESSDGRIAGYWSTLGYCYRAVGEEARARECCERGLEIVPDNSIRVREELCRQLEALAVQPAGD